MDADAWLKLQARLVAAGTRQADEGDTTRFGPYSAESLAQRDLKPSTVAHHRRLLDRLILPTPVQVHDLADAMAPGSKSHAKYRVMVLTAAWCGLRFGELTELRRKDLVIGDDGLPARIRVRRAVVRVDGEFVVDTPKSEAGVRDVTVPPHIRDDLGGYLQTLPAGGEVLLFPGSRNGAHMAPSSLYKPFYRARDVVGLPSLRWHDLRHFAATSAARTGATLAELQGFAGHSTSQAAMRYQHAASDSADRIAEGMSATVLPFRRRA